MRKELLILLVAFGVAACRGGGEEIIIENPNLGDGYVVADTETVSAGKSVTTTMDGNNLVVKTNRQVIRIIGQPGSKYQYRVWAGDKDINTADPDVIVDQGDMYVPAETVSGPTVIVTEE